MKQSSTYRSLWIVSAFIMYGVIAVLLNSCKVGPNYERAKLDTPDVFRFDSIPTDSSSEILWWKLYNDPTLDSLIKIGLEQNLDVRIAASRIEQARATVGFNRADQFPKIDVVANGKISSGNEISFDQQITTLSGGGSLTWEIDFWGKYRRGTEAARSELMGSEYAHRYVQITLISEIATTYFQLLDYKWRMEISKQTLETRDKGLDIIQHRFDEGIIPLIDVNQAQIQRAIAAASVPFYERQFAQTENKLSVLLGQNPQQVNAEKPLENMTIPPAIPVGIPSTLLEQRPDVRQAEELAHAQTARVGVAVAQRFPSFSLTGFLGGASVDLGTVTNSGLSWSAEMGVLAPLINFGKNKRRVDIEREKTKQAVLEYEKTVLNAFREVEDALIAIQTLNRENDARIYQVNAALQARETSKERYNKGITSYLEVLENDRSAFEAELQLSSIRRELLNAYIFLYKALGGGWLSDEEQSSNE